MRYRLISESFIRQGSYCGLLRLTGEKPR